jgi:hypothetical protein
MIEPSKPILDNQQQAEENARPALPGKPKGLFRAGARVHERMYQPDTETKIIRHLNVWDWQAPPSPTDK